MIRKLEYNSNTTRNGQLVTDSLIGRTYRSAMGYNVYMDENGDAEGLATLVMMLQQNRLSYRGITVSFTLSRWQQEERGCFPSAGSILHSLTLCTVSPPSNSTTREAFNWLAKSTPTQTVGKVYSYSNYWQGLRQYVEETWKQKLLVMTIWLLWELSVLA